MAIHPLGGALSFKADDPVEAALQGALFAAISLKFDYQLSSKPKRKARVKVQSHWRRSSSRLAARHRTSAATGLRLLSDEEAGALCKKVPSGELGVLSRVWIPSTRRRKSSILALPIR